MIRILIVLLYSSISFGAEGELPYFDQKELTPYWTQEKNFKPAQVTTFHAVDQNGQKVSEQTLAKKPSLVNFFFVQCPGICPVMMKSVRQFQKALGSKSEKIHIYSFSVQPKTDTPSQLKKYAKDYSIDLKSWTLLTGDQNEIYRVGKEMFKADGAVGEKKKDDGFSHTQNIYLLDGDLHIRGIYNTADEKAMAGLKADIEIITAHN